VEGKGKEEVIKEMGSWKVNKRPQVGKEWGKSGKPERKWRAGSKKGNWGREVREEMGAGSQKGRRRREVGKEIGGRMSEREWVREVGEGNEVGRELKRGKRSNRQGSDS
jgi:hypothetical protein